AGGGGLAARRLPHPPHRARVPGAVLHHAGRRRGGRRGHRPHGPRAVHGVPAAGAPPARMTPAAAPLAELLRALAPPLEYLAADDSRRPDPTRPTTARRA